MQRKRLRRARFYYDQQFSCRGKQFVEQLFARFFCHFIKRVRRGDEIVFLVGRKVDDVAFYRLCVESARFADRAGERYHLTFAFNQGGFFYAEQSVRRKESRARACSDVEHGRKICAVRCRFQCRKDRAICGGHTHDGIDRRLKFVRNEPRAVAFVAEVYVGKTRRGVLELRRTVRGREFFGGFSDKSG